jgi:hypothetical protein
MKDVEAIHFGYIGCIKYTKGTFETREIWMKLEKSKKI